ncbi:hypothetical protein HDV00_000992 [Rhizophlyctis rosea]|nr:hypothetical protein HDV00_000992 [Rhizophlyctis rosea]
MTRQPIKEISEDAESEEEKKEISMVVSIGPEHFLSSIKEKMEGASQAEQNALGAANIGVAVATGVGGAKLGEKLASMAMSEKSAQKAAGKVVGNLAGDVGGNLGGLALQLITQGATGQLSADVFAEDIKVLIIGELLEQALTKLAGVSAGPLMVVQLVGALLDTFWDPFKAYHQKDLDELHDKYQQAMKNELYTLRMKWPLVVTPEILPRDTEGNLAAPIRDQIRTYMREYLDLRGLVYVEDTLEKRMLSELSHFNDIKFLSTASGQLVGAVSDLGLQAQVLAAQMVVLYMRYREVRKKLAKTAIEREERRRWEAVKRYAGYTASFSCVMCLFLCCYLAIRKR